MAVPAHGQRPGRAPRPVQQQLPTVGRSVTPVPQPRLARLVALAQQLLARRQMPQATVRSVTAPRDSTPGRSTIDRSGVSRPQVRRPTAHHPGQSGVLSSLRQAERAPSRARRTRARVAQDKTRPTTATRRAGRSQTLTSTTRSSAARRPRGPQIFPTPRTRTPGVTSGSAEPRSAGWIPRTPVRAGRPGRPIRRRTTPSPPGRHGRRRSGPPCRSRKADRPTGPNRQAGRTQPSNSRNPRIRPPVSRSQYAGSRQQPRTPRPATSD